MIVKHIIAPHFIRASLTHSVRAKLPDHWQNFYLNVQGPRYGLCASAKTKDSMKKVEQYYRMFGYSEMFHFNVQQLIREHTQNNDINSILAIGQYLLVLAKKQSGGNSLDHARTLHSQALHLLHLNKAQLALPYLTQAQEMLVAINEKEENKQLLIRVILEIGQCYLMMGKFSQTIQYLSKHQTLVQNLGSSQGDAKIEYYQKLAAANTNVDMIPQALACSLTAIKEQAPQKQDYFGNLLNAAKLEIQSGQANKAFGYLDLACSATDQTSDDYVYQMGELVHLNQELHRYQQCLALIHQLNSFYVSAGHNQMGNPLYFWVTIKEIWCKTQLKLHEQAIHKGNQILEQLNHSNNYEIPYILIIVAYNQLRIGQTTQAQVTFTSALKSASDLKGAARPDAEVLNNLHNWVGVIDSYVRRQCDEHICLAMGQVMKALNRPTKLH